MRKRLNVFLVFLVLLSVPLLPGCKKEGDGQVKAQGKAVSGEKLTMEKASAALTAVSPDLEVVSVGDSPVEGLYEVVINDRGRKNIVYMDNNGTHVFTGKLINLATRSDVVQERMTDLNRVDMAKLDLSGTVRVGDPNAKHKVFIFDDPD